MSWQKFRRGPRPAHRARARFPSPLSRGGKDTSPILRPAERPPHPNLLPACGEKERAGVMEVMVFMARRPRAKESALPAVAGREKNYRIAVCPAALGGGTGPRPGRSGGAGCVCGGADDALGGSSGGGGGSFAGATALESG